MICDLYINYGFINKTKNTIYCSLYICYAPTPACKVVMERHVSKILLAIEGSRTGGNSTAVITVAQVISLGCLSSQNWTTSASLSES